MDGVYLKKDGDGRTVAVGSRPSDTAGRVVVYTQEGCPRCKRLIALCRSRGLDITVRDIADADAEAELRLVLSEAWQTEAVMPVVTLDGVFQEWSEFDDILGRMERCLTE